MAPLEQAAELAKRQMYYTCPSGYYLSNGYCYSSWSWWGRWVLLGVIILFFIAMLALLARRARRRRRLGQQPYYGTGWMAPAPKYGYNNNPNAYSAPPPQYSAAGAPPQQQQYTGQTFNPNDGYYGQQAYNSNQEGIQLQQPSAAYNRDNVYAPPAGPPPGKK